MTHIYDIQKPAVAICEASAVNAKLISYGRAQMLHWQYRLGSVIDCLACCSELRRREQHLVHEGQPQQ